MTEYIKKCEQCGSREFIVVETYRWTGKVDDSGVLNCTNAAGGINRISCADCGERHATGHFALIDFK